MKRTPLVLNRLILALALATQLFLVAPATQAVPQNTNSSNTGEMHGNHDNHNMRRSTRRNNRCRERCLRQYRQCTRGFVGPKAARCRQRYRECLRRCSY